MTNNVMLIHGAWHGAWCWQYVVDKLPNKDIHAIDLPGRHYEPGALKKLNLNKHVDYVAQVINKLPGKVTLVGHSMAGLIISQVAEKMPDKIDKLVYVCAFVPNHNESLFDIAKTKPDKGLSTEFIANTQENIIELNPSQRTQDLLYSQTSDKLTQDAMSRLCKEPFMGLVQKCKLPTMAFHKIPQIYIKCLFDKTMSPEFQDKMIAKLNNPQVVELAADHAPFFSNPEGLADIIS